MKTIIKSLLIILLFGFLVILIPLFIPDEEYSDSAKKWLDDANQPIFLAPYNNRFNALIGFYAAPHNDVFKVGEQLIAKANQKIEEHQKFDAIDLNKEDYWYNPTLNISNKLAHLDFDSIEKDPVQWLIDNQVLYKELMEKNKILLKRYRQHIQIKPFNNTLTHSLFAPIFPYSGLIAIMQLNNLSIIDAYINDNEAANKNNALMRLHANIDFSHLMMQQASTMIHKMVAINFLNRSLNTLSLFLDRSLLEKPAGINDIKLLRTMLTRLNTEQRSLLKPFKSEFALLSNSYYTEMIGSNDNSILDRTIKGILLAYSKPHTMQNHNYKYYWLPYLDKQQQALSERDDYNDKLQTSEYSWFDLYQAPSGYFQQEFSPDYDRYINSIDHLDSKILLLRVKADLYSQNISRENIQNHLDSLTPELNAGYSGASLKWDAKNHSLYFKIPNYERQEKEMAEQADSYRVDYPPKINLII